MTVKKAPCRRCVMHWIPTGALAANCFHSSSSSLHEGIWRFTWRLDTLDPVAVSSSQAVYDPSIFRSRCHGIPDEQVRVTKHILGKPIRPVPPYIRHVSGFCENVAVRRRNPGYRKQECILELTILRYRNAMRIAKAFACLTLRHGFGVDTVWRPCDKFRYPTRKY